MYECICVWSERALQLAAGLPMGTNTKIQINPRTLKKIGSASWHSNARIPTKCACARPTKVGVVKNNYATRAHSPPCKFSGSAPTIHIINWKYRSEECSLCLRSVARIFRRGFHTVTREARAKIYATTPTLWPHPLINDRYFCQGKQQLRVSRRL